MRVGILVLLGAGMLVAVGAVLFSLSVVKTEQQVFVDSSNPDVRTVETVSEDSKSPSSRRRERCTELRVKDDEWVRDGPFVEWNAAGAKLAEGAYRRGKRHGPWTFWKDDGSVDPARSGLYADDVLVHGVPSPKGDFDPDDR